MHDWIKNSQDTNKAKYLESSENNHDTHGTYVHITEVEHLWTGGEQTYEQEY